MGYESRVYVCQKGIITKDCVYCGKIATFDLGGMGGNFFDLFNKKLPKEWRLYEGDFQIHEDKYGKALTYTDDIEDVVKWLEKSKENFGYRRSELLKTFLKEMELQIKHKKWSKEEIVLIHYGY